MLGGSFSLKDSYCVIEQSDGLVDELDAPSFTPMPSQFLSSTLLPSQLKDGTAAAARVVAAAGSAVQPVLVAAGSAVQPVLAAAGEAVGAQAEQAWEWTCTTGVQHVQSAGSAVGNAALVQAHSLANSLSATIERAGVRLGIVAPSGVSSWLPSEWHHNRGLHTEEARLVALEEWSAEFTDLVALFHSTLSENKFQIRQIDRVENCWLHLQFSQRRALMCARPSAAEVHERLLFHGCSDAQTVLPIATNGFNRSFCGKNATVYGQGVVWHSCCCSFHRSLHPLCCCAAPSFSLPTGLPLS